MANHLPIGPPDGWTPWSEDDHKMFCPVSGEMLDMRRIESWAPHWHDGPQTKKPHQPEG